MASEKIRYARSRDGAQIGWAECGKGRTTLLMAPNAVMNIAEDRVNPLRAGALRAFSEQFRVVRYDDRGFGHSSRGVAYGMDLWADDIEAVADAACGDEPFALFGQSVVYGSLAFAARAPERLSHLVIYAGKARGLAHSGSPDLMAAARARLEIRRLGWANGDAGARAMLTAYLAKDMTEAEQRFFAERKMAAIANVDDVVRASEAEMAADARPLLGTIRTPTLIGHARGDQAAPFALGQALAQEIPGATFVEVAGENHALRERDGSLQSWVGHVTDFVCGRPNAADGRSELSKRELSVLDGLCDGLTNEAIAARLGISDKTVRNHLTQVFEKLGVANRTQAVLAASRWAHR